MFLTFVKNSNKNDEYILAVKYLLVLSGLNNATNVFSHSLVDDVYLKVSRAKHTNKHEKVPSNLIATQSTF